MRIALQKKRALESIPLDSTSTRPNEPPDAETGTERGILSVVSVPIGDLDDITVRALRVLREADLIVAEDLWITRRLLQWHGVAAPEIVSLRPRQGQEAREAMQSALENGRNVALSCDAGTPGIADPGRKFIDAALACGAAVSAVPGPCAALAALTVSGLPASCFSFLGFPPRAPAARAEFFRKLSCETGTAILYEKSAALSATLTALCRACADSRPVVLACDLTKPTERIWRGTLAELRDSCKANPPRGECVLVLGRLTEKNRI